MFRGRHAKYIHPTQHSKKQLQQNQKYIITVLFAINKMLSFHDGFLACNLWDLQRYFRCLVWSFDKHILESHFPGNNMACIIDAKTNATMWSCSYSNIRSCYNITQVQSYYTKCRKIRASSYIPESDHCLKYKKGCFMKCRTNSSLQMSTDSTKFSLRIVNLGICSSIAVVFLSCKCKYSSVVACNHDAKGVALT